MPEDSLTESTASPPEGLLVCKKTGKAMTWDDAHCPNKGETCAYRGECQILVVLAERRSAKRRAGGAIA